MTSLIPCHNADASLQILNTLPPATECDGIAKNRVQRNPGDDELLVCDKCLVVVREVADELGLSHLVHVTPL